MLNMFFFYFSRFLSLQTMHFASLFLSPSHSLSFTFLSFMYSFSLCLTISDIVLSLSHVVFFHSLSLILYLSNMYFSSNFFSPFPSFLYISLSCIFAYSLSFSLQKMHFYLPPPPYLSVDVFICLSVCFYLCISILFSLSLSLFL